MDEELGPNEVMIEAGCGKGEEGVGVAIRRTIPLDMKGMVVMYGEAECAFMLREAIRSRIQRRAYLLVKAVATGKPDAALSDDVSISVYMNTWNPPGELPKTKEERLVDAVVEDFDNLSIDQKKRILAKLREDTAARKAAKTATEPPPKA